MENFFRKIWDAIVSFISKVPYDKLLHFIAGVIISAFFCIALNEKYCFFPVIFFAFAKEFFDVWTTKKWDWWDFGATLIGGAVPQVFVLLNIWWF